MNIDEIIEQAKQNDSKATEEVFSQAKKISRSFLRNKFTELHHTMAEDWSHDMAAHTLLNIDKFDSSRGKFYSFVCTITHNKAQSIYSSKTYRNDKKNVSILNGNEEDDNGSVIAYAHVPDEDPNPEESLLLEDSIARLDKLFAIAGKDEELMRTYFNEELTSDEASELFNMRPSTVRVKIKRFRHKIEHLKKEYSLN